MAASMSMSMGGINEEPSMASSIAMANPLGADTMTMADGANAKATGLASTDAYGRTHALAGTEAGTADGSVLAGS